MQRVRLDSCLYTGVSFHLLCFTAKVSNVFTVFYNDLVAPSSQSQINSGTGMLITCIIRRTLDSNTNTQCHRHLVTDFNCLDIFQNAELVVHHRFEIFVLKYDKIFVFFNFTYQRIHLCKILVYLSVYQCNQKRTFYVFNTIKRLIIVVNVYKSCNLFLFLIFLLIMTEFSLVKQIQRRKEFLGIIYFNRFTLFHDIIKVNTVE